MAERKPRGKFVSNEVFIPAWLAAVKSGGGAKEVSAKTGLTANSVLARAAKIRKLLKEAGVAADGNIGNMQKGGGPRTNPTELAALVASFKASQSEGETSEGSTEG